MGTRVAAVRLPDDDHAALVASAAARDTTVNDWLKRIVRAQIDHDREQGKIT